MFKNFPAVGMFFLFFVTFVSVLTGYSNETVERKLKSSELDLTTQRVIVFKDGYCMVIKKGVVKTDADGKAFTEEVPEAAVLGSFWAIPESGAVIKSTTAGWVKTVNQLEAELDCKTVLEILQANQGAQCSFMFDERELSGKILKVLASKTPTNTNPATLESLGIEPLRFRTTSQIPTASRSETGPLRTATITATSGNFFILKTSTGDMVVPVNGISHLAIDGMKSKIKQTVKQSVKQKRLTFQFDKANSEVEMLMMYFRPGVRWIPTYRVGLTEDEFVNKNHDENKPRGADQNRKNKTAEIVLQGEIINEAEDLIDMPINVVVGVPNFRFRSVASPMILENTLRHVLAQMPANVVGNGMNLNSMSNALYTQRSSEFRSSRATGAAPAADVTLPDELESSAGNDLFVYKLPRMSLKQGERATVPILQTKVPYRDIYTWDIHLKHSETYAATSSGSVSPLLLSKNEVWRQVELINETNIPWTTGAAMFVDGFQPLAQDLLTYTSPGGICRVPVTVAVDMRGKVEDKELGRDLKALRWRGHDYAKISGEIVIELANNKTEPIPVEVRIRFGGKATKATDEGKITYENYQRSDWVIAGNHAINNSSKLFWTAAIEPGECFKPIVNYEFYVRY